MNDTAHLLDVQELKTHFFTIDGVAKAVDDVTFHIDEGEILGLVGESGCGKSVTALSVMRLLKPPVGRVVQGSITFKGEDLLNLDMAAMRKVRGDRISMIFQEPMTSLNPVYTIGNQIAEMLVVHHQLGHKDAWEKAVAMIEKVHIPSPEKRAHAFPHQLSGGMRQRAMIAMALICTPELLIADEPTTALDVTIQAQIIDLMLELKDDFGAAVLMITHDLGVIAEMARRVAVMYAGRIVESALVEEIFEDPWHPYTQGLLRSIPRLGARALEGRNRLNEIAGIVPSLFHLPEGCAFHPRCGQAMDICRREAPGLTVKDGRQVRCWLRANPAA